MIIDYEVQVYGSGNAIPSSNLWYQENNTFQYIEGGKLAFHCPFQLGSFPFDSHACTLYISKNPYESSLVTLNPLRIMCDGMETSVDEMPIISDKFHQSYKIKLETDKKGTIRILRNQEEWCKPQTLVLSGHISSWHFWCLSP